MANNIDKTDGQWKSFETGDKNTIVFWQQRGQVSVSRIIKWTSSLWQKPENVEEFVKLGPCPVMTFAPTSCDSTNDLKTIVAMGIAIDGIEMFNEMNFSDIISKLQNDMPLRAKIYRKFIIATTTDYKSTQEILQSFIKSSNLDNDLIAEALDSDNFLRASQIAKALHPHLARLPVDIRKWLKMNNCKREAGNVC